MAQKLTLKVTKEAVKQRADAYLTKELPELSRSRIQNLLAHGNICLNDGAKIKPSYKMSLNDVIIVSIPPARPAFIEAQEIELNIIYEDDDLVVINKSPGLVVHPGAGHHEGTLANALLYRYPDMHVGDAPRPGLVHRLDKETSGVMVCARHDKSFVSITAQFRDRSVRKIYKAFCFGSFKDLSFELITGHARHKSDRKRFTTKLEPPSQTASGVRLAHSRFTVNVSGGGVSELEVELLTGRTHQIRAHLADIHRPLLKDALYSSSSLFKQLPIGPVRDAVLALERHALHAYSLEIVHPSTNKKMHFTAELPEDLRAISDALRFMNIEE